MKFNTSSIIIIQSKVSFDSLEAVLQEMIKVVCMRWAIKMHNSIHAMAFN